MMLRCRRHVCTASRLRCSVNVASDTSSVLMTSALSGLLLAWVLLGFRRASRKRAYRRVGQQQAS
jgi:hypothetical protein